jgi:putative acetyltransferase
MIEIRRGRPGDAQALLDLSCRAIRRSAAGFYTSEQLEAWAGRRRLDRHERLLAETVTLVAVIEGAIAGFAAIAITPTASLERGEVDQLFVDPDSGARGVARMLLAAVEETARAAGLTRLMTHASWRAVPVFERAGYAQTSVETVQVDGETLTRAAMEKLLAQ